MVFEKPGTVAIATQGCKVNRYDSQVILEGLLERGWQQLEFGEAADLVIINSCTVTSGSDRDLRKLVRQARRASPDARIMVTGCKAEVDPEGTLDLDEVDEILGNTLKDRLPEFIELGSEDMEIPSQIDRVEDRGITELDGRARPILKIQDGCNLRCSFCIVPSARGDSRSRSAQETVAQARILAATGHRELVLSGIQLGFYRDPDGQASKLEDLLKLLLDETEGIRFRLGSMLPRHMRPALLDLFVQAQDRLCPHFHISLQSGDDDILKAMKRPYRSGHFRELMQELWTRLEKPCLGTDIIAGFSGEDETAFRNTMTLISELPMAYGHVFPFSLRPGTPAEKLGDNIRPEIKKARVAELRALFDEKQSAYRRQQVGRRLQVLVETRQSNEWLRGTSENYQQVLVPENLGAIGDLIPLEISGLEDGILCHHPQTKRANS